jgi:hypothetical protein
MLVRNPSFTNHTTPDLNLQTIIARQPQANSNHHVGQKSIVHQLISTYTLSSHANHKQIPTSYWSEIHHSPITQHQISTYRLLSHANHTQIHPAYWSEIDRPPITQHPISTYTLSSHASRKQIPTIMLVRNPSFTNHTTPDLNLQPIIARQPQANSNHHVGQKSIVHQSHNTRFQLTLYHRHATASKFQPSCWSEIDCPPITQHPISTYELSSHANRKQFPTKMSVRNRSLANHITPDLNLQPIIACQPQANSIQQLVRNRSSTNHTTPDLNLHTITARQPRAITLVRNRSVITISEQHHPQTLTNVCAKRQEQQRMHTKFLQSG